MYFPLDFFETLVLGAVVLAAAGALLLVVLFLRDSKSRRLW